MSEDRAVTWPNEKTRKADLRRRALANIKFNIHMKCHALWWRILHLTMLARIYSVFMCRKNWYRKYPDGRCAYCGNSHNKIKGKL